MQELLARSEPLWKYDVTVPLPAIAIEALQVVALLHHQRSTAH
jgi:hypothetical protein